VTYPGRFARSSDRLARSPLRLAWLTALLLWAPPLLFLGVFFFYPLAAIFQVGLSAGGWQSLSPEVWGRIGRPFGFTLFQASLSTVLTLLIGIPGAYLFARYTFPGKRIIRVLTVIPFILPTVVVAASFNALLGPRGLVNLGLMGLLGLEAPPIHFLNTLWAILLAHVFYNTTIVLTIVGTAWERLGPRLSEAAQVLGANRWRTFWTVTLPLLRPSLASAALLVFLFDFTSFGVVLLLGGPRFATLEVEIYVQALHLLNLPMASLLSIVQLASTLVLTVAYTRLNAAAVVPVTPQRVEAAARPPRPGLEKLAVWMGVGLLLVLLVSPLASLAVRSFTRLEAERGERGEVAYGFTTRYYQELFINRRQALFYVPPIEAARNSLVYAGATVIISVGLGFLAAYALQRDSPLNRLMEPLILLPLGTSAVTLGLGFVLVFNRPPLELRSFPLLLPIAHSLVALPFVVRTLQPAIGAIPNSLRQAAAVLGASPWRVWREVDLPIIARAALVGAIFAFTISLGEFGATTFLARPEYPTLPVAIFRFLSQPGALNYGQALAMATILMAICSAGILVIERLRLPGIGDF